MDNLNFEFFDNCTSLNDAARKIFGRDNYRDCTNNKEENLQLFCPNCHSLTETFGNLKKIPKEYLENKKEIYKTYDRGVDMKAWVHLSQGYTLRRM